MITSVFSKRQAKDAGILIAATRWHEDDLIGRIKRKMAAGEIEPYDVLTLPGLATDRPHVFICGSTRFVDTAADGLVALGYEPLSIRTERFGATGG